MGVEQKRYLEPTLESGAAFAARRTKGPVFLLHLLRFRGTADYSASPQMAPPKPISGEAAFGLFLKHIEPYLREAGGEMVFLGNGGRLLIGPSDERWDKVLLVRQRGAADLLKLAFHPGYRAGLGHRTAALEDSRLLPLTEPGQG